MSDNDLAISSSNLALIKFNYSLTFLHQSLTFSQNCFKIKVNKITLSIFKDFSSVLKATENNRILLQPFYSLMILYFYKCLLIGKANFLRVITWKLYLNRLAGCCGGIIIVKKIINIFCFLFAVLYNSELCVFVKVEVYLFRLVATTAWSLCSYLNWFF